MKVSVEIWTIEKLASLRGKINEQPEYQRGEVWNANKKKLLIDSILRGIDIPKIYIRKLNNNAFTYEVADGQQRYTSILNFLDDEIKLDTKYERGLNLSIIEGIDVGGLKYSALPSSLRKKFNTYELTMAIVENSTADEIRTLFGRLQLGTSLNAAEKRNAIVSSLGNHINTFALNHSFFVKSKIPNKRYRHQDYMANAMALVKYSNAYDLKANLLNQMYLDRALVLNQSEITVIDAVLDKMSEIDLKSKERIINKFPFLDFFWFLYNRNGTYKSIDSQGIADEFTALETNRRVHYSDGAAKLIQKSKPSEKDRKIYDYIDAFYIGGALTQKINTRQQVYDYFFSKYFH